MHRQTLFGPYVVKSVGFSNKQIISDIMYLYGIEMFDLDCTYSSGKFWEGLPKPKHKTDINPQAHDVKKHDSRNLPFKDGSLGSIMFDPPFLPANGGRTFDRFSGYKNIEEMMEHYKSTLIECFRILKRKGILVFKCQDFVNRGTNHFVHCDVYRMANNVGFYARDLFILVAKSRMKPPGMKRQVHARKFHCYFWVFQKK